MVGANVDTASTETIHPTDTVKVRVINSQMDELRFRIPIRSRLRKMMAVYSRMREISQDQLRFFLNGQEVSRNATPQVLDIEENDVINVLTVGVPAA